jgi:hypothetical protein
MKFKATPPNENFALARFVSKEGRWELGLRPMLFGVRASLGAVGAFGPCVDYCAGAKFEDQVTLLSALLTILENLPEEMTEKEMRNFFPEQRVRPMYNDPECWAKLSTLAGEEFARYHSLG